jgi:hypothetical protein
MPVSDERPGRAPTRVPWVVAAGAAAAVAVAGALWLAGDRRVEPRPTAPAPPSPAPSPAPRYFLIVDLRRVDEVAVTDRVKEREVRAVAQSVRETMAGVYGAGFVYPDQWQGGRFPTLFQYFAGQARPQARRDLQDLSLGRTANRLGAVRPERARVNVRVMVGPTGHPLAAVAGMEFRATGLGADGLELPIRHLGRYMLRRVGGGWRIVAYDVRGRLGSRR